MLWGLIFAATAGKFAAYCGAAATISAALVGLIFRGAASAWREERDAAVDKADRLEETVKTQAAQILTLEGKVEVLEKRTDYEAYAERSGREHKQISDTLEELARATNANTTAIEFLIKQVFPAAVDSALRPAVIPPAAA